MGATDPGNVAHVTEELNFSFIDFEFISSYSITGAEFLQSSLEPSASSTSCGLCLLHAVCCLDSDSTGRNAQK